MRRPVFYEDRYPDEESPKRTTERGQGYSMGKVELERLFTDAAELIKAGTAPHLPGG